MASAGRGSPRRSATFASPVASTVSGGSGRLTKRSTSSVEVPAGPPARATEASPRFGLARFGAAVKADAQRRASETGRPHARKTSSVSISSEVPAGDPEPEAEEAVGHVHDENAQVGRLPSTTTNSATQTDAWTPMRPPAVSIPPTPRGERPLWQASIRSAATVYDDTLDPSTWREISTPVVRRICGAVTTTFGGLADLKDFGYREDEEDGSIVQSEGLCPASPSGPPAISVLVGRVQRLEQELTTVSSTCSEYRTLVADAHGRLDELIHGLPSNEPMREALQGIQALLTRQDSVIFEECGPLNGDMSSLTFARPQEGESSPTGRFETATETLPCADEDRGARDESVDPQVRSSAGHLPPVRASEPGPVLSAAPPTLVLRIPPRTSSTGAPPTPSVLLPPRQATPPSSPLPSLCLMPASPLPVSFHQTPPGTPPLPVWLAPSPGVSASPRAPIVVLQSPGASLHARVTLHQTPPTPGLKLMRIEPIATSHATPPITPRPFTQAVSTPRSPMTPPMVTRPAVIPSWLVPPAAAHIQSSSAVPRVMPPLLSSLPRATAAPSVVRLGSVPPRLVGPGPALMVGRPQSAVPAIRPQVATPTGPVRVTVTKRWVLEPDRRWVRTGQLQPMDGSLKSVAL